jgi:1-acyl-sn-glycerol-3-phosphate acyltransferase
LGLSLVAPKAARVLVPKASRLWLKLSGVGVNVEGKMHGGPCMVIANHSSLLDALVVMASSPRPLRFLVAPWIYDHPLLARGIRGLGHLRATRGDTNKASQVAEEMQRLLAQGESVATFPEGGLETSPGLRPFALGAFQVAAQSGLPIQPLAIIGTRQAMAWPHLVPKRTRLVARYGPILHANGSDIAAAAELARRCRDWLAANCGEPLLQERLRRQD